MAVFGAFHKLLNLILVNFFNQCQYGHETKTVTLPAMCVGYVYLCVSFGFHYTLTSYVSS